MMRAAHAAARLGAPAPCAIRLLSPRHGAATPRPRRTRATTVRATKRGRAEGLVPTLAPGKAKELWEEIRDPTRLGQRGEAWFLAQAVGVFLVCFPPAPVEALVGVAGVAAIFGGLGLIVVGSRDLGTNLTPLPVPRDEHSLVTEGVYGLCRHPMYGGILLGCLGIACAADDTSRVVLTLALFAVLDNKASFEEQQLEDRYGQAYKQYKRSTKKFVPYVL